MSVLTKGLAMDFIRQGRKEMAITSIWPATVCPRTAQRTALVHMLTPTGRRISSNRNDLYRLST